MEELISVLKPRFKDEIDQEYMEAAIHFLNHFELINFINQVGIKDVDLSNLKLNEFIQWLNERSNPNDELVSFSSALTYAAPHWGSFDPSIEEIFDYFDEYYKNDPLTYLVGVIEIHRSIEKLSDIVNGN